MKIIALANQKGGVGKTNTAINFSAALAHFNRNVLLIDMDPQGNTSRGYGIDTSLLSNTIMDVIFSGADINKCIIPTMIEGLDIIPSKLVISLDENTNGNYNLVKKALNKLNKQYDYIIIDCPPSLGFLTMNCLCAANSLLIPVQCEYFALNAITQILSNVATIQSDYNPNLEIEGVLLTMYDPESELDNDIANEVRNIFKEKTYSTRIPRTNSIPESNVRGIPVLLWRPSGKASTAYLNLAKEVIDLERI